MTDNEQDIARRTERRLRAIFDAEPACVKIVSADGIILDMNRAGVEMLGAIDLSQIVGRGVLDLVHPADRPRYAHMHRLTSGGSPTTWEFRIIGFHGRELWMEAHSVPFEEEPGNRPAAVLSVTSDVTERKNLEEQLRQSQRLEAVGRLAGGVAHDFNNLLTAVLGNCNLAALALPEGHPAQENLAEVHDAAERAAALIRQLLAFSRKQALSPRVLDINEAVRALARILPRVIGEDITTELRLDPDLLRVRVDATQLDQVLLNLALNARDAMPAGGTLTIATSNVSLAAAPVAASAHFQPGPYVKLTLSDTGQGMDAVTRDRLFEPFFTTKNSGTGLGLATTYGIVTQSRGFISVDSEPERGTTFTIHLPATTEAVERPQAAAPVLQHVPSGTETVLLVEDAPAVRSFAARTLGAHGYTVLEAASGDEALRVAETRTFDLLLTDVVMPGMNGVELAAHVASVRPAARVMLMSGYDESRSHAPQADETVPFLRKPFNATTLAHAVRTVLDAPRP
jgi:two-component system, cell cycle sensor histidine kinase and response regulator CckA